VPATLNLYAGEFHWQSNGTITTCTVFGGAKLTVGDDLLARTITTLTLYAGAQFSDPAHTVTFTNAFSIPDGIWTDVKVSVGPGRSYQVS